MSLAEQRELLAQARAQGLDTNFPAIAIQATLVDGVDPDTNRALLEPAVLLEPIPHPILAATLDVSGAHRRGRMSWSVGLGDGYHDAPLQRVRDNLMPGLLWPEASTYNTKGPINLHNAAANRKHNATVNAFAGTPAGHLFHGAAAATALNAHMPNGGDGFGAVTLSNSNGRVAWIKVITHMLTVPQHLPQIPLNLRPAGDKPYVEPRPVLATHAVAVMEWLTAQGVLVVDPDPNAPIAKLRKRIANSVIGYPTPGAPALAEVSVGSRIRSLVPDLLTDDPEEGEAATRGDFPAEDVAAALRAAPVVDSCLHPGTADMGVMALAEPHPDESLWDYQRDAVGRHTATSIGYLNLCSPGMGKTVMTLVGMRERSLRATAPYRGLVVAEANVRDQWTKETRKWFPEAHTVTVTSHTDSVKVEKTLTEAGSEPVVIIASYAMLNSVVHELARRAELEEMAAQVDYVEPTQLTTGTTGATGAAVPAVFAGSGLEVQLGLFGDDEVFGVPGTDMVAEEPEPEEAPEEEKIPATLGQLLLDTPFDDLIADEAEVLRGTGSKQGAAMWELRSRAQVAVALTGTPINKGLDDLGRLISWARNDARLFYGVKLSDRFDMSKDSELERFTREMGAVLFRRDTSEIAEDLPTVSAEVIKLQPSAAEKALADAARMELKRVYEELSAAIEHAEMTDPDNPAYETAREALKNARGAWLGGTQLARMASSDPAALLGSQSAGAALLAGQGLIAAATATTGTKRAAVVNDVCQRVGNGKAVLIFTEFATVARGIIDDLDAAGVRVGEVLGGGGKKRDQMVEDFQNGDLDVLVCTSSGERGLNLQRAQVVVHYDLPWTPKGVIQRTGRARRLKSDNKHLTVVFPLMLDTIEERVAGLVVTRAVEAMRALDTSRGVDSSATEMGLALGGLATAMTETREGRSQGAQLLQITEALVA